MKYAAHSKTSSAITVFRLVIIWSFALAPVMAFAQDPGSAVSENIETPAAAEKGSSASSKPSPEKVTPKKPAKGNPVLRPIADVPGLPRVLLIGDSISMGYTLGVRERLQGRANVHRISANGGPTTRGLASIERWLGDSKWDLIHFNWGIHDLRHMPSGERQVEPKEYEANLRTLVNRLRETGAVLIWAAITPIPKGKLNPDRTFGDETEYNEIAARVMRGYQIPINDLHSYVLPRFAELQRPMDLHYKPEGSDYLAEQVSREIGERLPDRK
ncbi:MAG: SGNH/GDSL hydrolase family protein [Rubripirellula sp.]